MTLTLAWPFGWSLLRSDEVLCSSIVSGLEVVEVEDPVDVVEDVEVAVEVDEEQLVSECDVELVIV